PEPSATFPSREIRNQLALPKRAELVPIPRPPSLRSRPRSAMCSCAESFQSIPGQSTVPVGHPVGSCYFSMDQKSPSTRLFCPPVQSMHASAVLLAVTPPASCFYLWQKEIDSQLRVPVHPRCASTPLLFLDRDVSRRIPHRRHRP